MRKWRLDTESTTTKRNLYRASAHIISGKSLKDILVRANKLKHLLQRSIAHKINVEILEEKYKKKSQCFSSNLRTKSMIKYTSYKNLRNLLRQLALLQNQLYSTIKELKISASTVTGVRSLSKARKLNKRFAPTVTPHTQNQR